jgi:hypothetical protein
MLNDNFFEVEEHSNASEIIDSTTEYVLSRA